MLKIRSLCYLSLVLTSVPAESDENTLIPEVDVELKLILNYSEAAERLKILDKRASFRTGGRWHYAELTNSAIWHSVYKLWCRLFT